MLSEKTEGYEYGLTQKQAFYLYLYRMCPSLDILHILWDMYSKSNSQETLEYHQQISPFKSHPLGMDSLFHPVGGFIDPDVFLMYYTPRECYLLSIKMIGHPYFFCQFNKTYAELTQSSNYYQTLINEPQIKLRPLQKTRSLNRALQYLLDGYPLFTKEQIMRYINSIYTMYKNNRILYAYPISIDREGTLCRFE